ncbi:MAG: hypothetical protein ACW98Y_16220, partial [Candidatus Thorarchaeota archaeon]
MGTIFEDLFRSPVPILTPLFNLYVSVISAIVLGTAFVLMIPLGFSPYAALLSTALIVGILIQIFLTGLMPVRYQYPESELNDLVSKITSRLVLRNDISIWSRKSLTPYAVPLFTLTHRAVLLSTSMIHL